MRLYIVLVFAIALSSCDFVKNQSLREINSSYKKGLKVFDRGFVDHFPNEVRSLNSTYFISNDIAESHPGIWLKTELDNAGKVSSLIKKNAIAIYNSDDTCLLVIDQHLSQENRFKYDKTLRVSPKLEIDNRDCKKSKYPVPNFWEENFFETSSTDVGLRGGYKLYVLKAEKGIFLDSKLLPNGKYTPVGWEHGYTKGVAIDSNRSIAIYWFDIW